MKSFGTTDCDVEPIAVWKTEEKMVTQLEWYLGDSRPFVIAVECFPGLEQTKKNIYTGKLADYYNSNSRRIDGYSIGVVFGGWSSVCVCR
jgi:hypothetical protein